MSFTASNGVTITGSAHARTWQVRDEGSEIGDKRFVPLNVRKIDALREFFQHERDEELGRWRWPENPLYVVYPRADHVQVVNELSGNALNVSRAQANVSTGLDRAARAYFEAHPERKPWHDAKEGEVWVLDLIASGEGSWFVNYGYFQSTKSLVNRPLTDAAFRSGRRIFPEQKS